MASFSLASRQKLIQNWAMIIGIGESIFYFSFLLLYFSENDKLHPAHTFQMLSADVLSFMLRFITDKFCICDGNILLSTLFGLEPPKRYISEWIFRDI